MQPPKQPPVKVPKKQAKASHQEAASFFTAYNADVGSHPCFFEAVFTARQQVQDGRPLQRLLKEAISSLQLAVGTILKGTPCLAGNRIKIRLTAAVFDPTVRRVNLVCLEQEDCRAGLYPDALSAQLAAAMQEELVGEVLDWAFEEGVCKEPTSREKIC